jgi:hypothetical protein
MRYIWPHTSVRLGYMHADAADLHLYIYVYIYVCICIYIEIPTDAEARESWYILLTYAADVC